MGLFSRKKKVQEPKEEPRQVTFDVAGISYYESDFLDIMNERSLYTGKCRLVPEPENRFDPDAVKVTVLGLHIGYVPMSRCPVVRAHLTDATRMDIELRAEGNDYSGTVTLEW